MNAPGNVAANNSAKTDGADVVPAPRPPGRPKGSLNRVTREIRDLTQKYSLRCVRKLWKLAMKAEAEETQLKAATLLLAYAHGRPTETREIGGIPDGKPVEVLSDLELARRVGLMLDKGRREIGGRDDVAPDFPAGQKALLIG